MIAWFREVDRVLRGEATRPESLADSTIDVSGRRLLIVNVILGMISGLCVSAFALFNREVPEYRQPLAAAVKVPALFLLTLAVTFPSLYVFNALVGSRLRVITLGRLMMASLGVTLAVLASFGPIVAFFSVTTTSYPFMLLLNVAVFAMAGLLGMSFLYRTIHRLTSLRQFSPPQPPPTQSVEPAGDVPVELTPRPILRREPVDTTDDRVRRIFVTWMLVYGLVGAQMSWVLRPFLGSPNQAFEWFRPRSSNFFEAVANTIRALFGG